LRSGSPERLAIVVNVVARLTFLVRARCATFASVFHRSRNICQAHLDDPSRAEPHEANVGVLVDHRFLIRDRNTKNCGAFDETLENAA
jgi:hypothetical protein